LFNISLHGTQILFYSMPPFTQYIFMAWCLVKHMDSFAFTIILFYITGWILCVMIYKGCYCLFTSVW